MISAEKVLGGKILSRVASPKCAVAPITHFRDNPLMYFPGTLFKIFKTEEMNLMDIRTQLKINREDKNAKQSAAQCL